MDDHVSPVGGGGPIVEQPGGVSSPVSDEGGLSFPGLLPAPVPATDKVIRRVGWVASLGASLVVLLVGAFVLGWLARGDAPDSAAPPVASASGQPVVSLTDRWEEPVVAVAEAV
nr:hypothetical protein [Acidimicrobiales bacterium]